LSQLALFFFNSAGFWWTVYIILDKSELTNAYIAYMITVVLFNIIEFISTIILASQTRKGVHAKLFFVSDITNLICKTNEDIK